MLPMAKEPKRPSPSDLAFCIVLWANVAMLVFLTAESILLGKVLTALLATLLANVCALLAVLFWRRHRSWNP